VWSAYVGTGHDFPNYSEVSLDVVKKAMRELLTSGGKRPTSVSWQAGNKREQAEDAM